MKRKLVRIGIPIVLVVLALSAYKMFSSNADSTESEYFTAAVTRGPLKRVVNATGVVQTVVTVQVGSQVSGQVEELYADFNSVVKRGQLLAKLDTRNLDAQLLNSRASVAAAQARLRSAEAEIQTHAANVQSSRANVEVARATRDNSRLQFDRANELSVKGLSSQTDLDNAKANFDSNNARYDQAAASLQQVEAQSVSTEAQIAQAKAGLQQAEADLSRAEINLEYANIISPVDGVVISRDVDVGQTIAASMQTPTLFAIATDLGQMQVKASVDEADIGSISENADVTFTVDAYPNDVFTGKIAEIRLSPQTVQNVVTYSVILSIENREHKLKPGMTANITIMVAERANALKVPNAALRYNPPGTPDSPAGETTFHPAEASESASAGDSAGASIPQAPGQRWNPDDKLRFVTGEGNSQRSGTIWILGADGKAQRRDVVLGITDGASTELISGDITETDQVIVGDATQVDSVNQAQPGFLGGGQRGR